MNWAHVILAGYVGAVIAIAVGVFRKKGWVGKISAAVITVVAIIAWNIFDVHYLIPRDRVAQGQTSAQQFDAVMSKMPTFQVLKEQEPAFWQQLRSQALQMERDGKTEQQIIDAIQPQVLRIQMLRLQQAPDRDVVDYMKVNMEQIAAVQKKGDDECFRFLFPAVKGGINPVRVIPQEILTRRIETDVRMMRAAYGPDKHTVTEDEKQQATQDLQHIVPALVQQYGQDIQIMADPLKGVGKEKITCDMAQALWSQVLELPQKNAAGVIRLSLSEEMQ